MTEQKASLLPCPFCGGEAEVVDATQGAKEPFIYVECLACYHWGPAAMRSERAIELWNKRTELK